MPVPTAAIEANPEQPEEQEDADDGANDDAGDLATREIVTRWIGCRGGLAGGQEGRWGLRQRRR
jgi:hypothetical protein